jgi:hypothetical protein
VGVGVRVTVGIRVTVGVRVTMGVRTRVGVSGRVRVLVPARTWTLLNGVSLGCRQGACGEPAGQCARVLGGLRSIIGNKCKESGA